MTRHNIVLIGSQIKMAVNFGYQGTALTIDDLDEITFTFYSPLSPSGGQTFAKRDLIRRVTTVNNMTVVEWFAIVDTSVVGQGQLKLRVDALIPDTDSPSFYRREMEECETNLFIV